MQRLTTHTQVRHILHFAFGCCAYRWRHVRPTQVRDTSSNVAQLQFLSTIDSQSSSVLVLLHQLYPLPCKCYVWPRPQPWMHITLSIAAAPNTFRPLLPSLFSTLHAPVWPHLVSSFSCSHGWRVPARCAP
jgi:hypothetical protein